MVAGVFGWSRVVRAARAEKKLIPAALARGYDGLVLLDDGDAIDPSHCVGRTGARDEADGWSKPGRRGPPAVTGAARKGGGLSRL